MLNVKNIKKSITNNGDTPEFAREKGINILSPKV